MSVSRVAFDSLWVRMGRGYGKGVWGMGYGGMGYYDSIYGVGMKVFGWSRSTN